MSRQLDAGKAFMARYPQTFNALAAEESKVSKQDIETVERLTQSLEYVLKALEASTDMVLILHKEVMVLKAKVAYLMGDTYQ